MHHTTKNHSRILRRGMTLLETLIGIAIIAVVAFSIYQGLSVILRVLAETRVKIAATSIANEEMELIRNIPYSKVGTVGGIPPGVIASTTQAVRDVFTFQLAVTIRNIDDPFDGVQGGIPNDLSPADYKLVELTVQCVSCAGATSPFTFTGRVAPKNLETASTNGSLFIQAIDASGQPVSDTVVQVVNNLVNPAVNITDVTGADGFLRIVDAVPSAQSYQVTVSKSGYSTDRTYATSTQNPNPTKPYATVARGQVTQISFAIDRVSSLNAASLTTTCSAVPNIGFSLVGSKLIGANPNVLKFSGTYATDGSGVRAIQGLEWDTYGVSVSGSGYDLAGTIPTVPLMLPPATNQNMRFIMRPQNPNALMVTVKDAVTGLPLSGASVTLIKTGYANTLITGRGFLRQTDWSGGSGQAEALDLTKYAEDDGNMDVSGTPGTVRLREEATSTYPSSGVLTSSTFNTGSPSNFYDLAFLPAVQPPATGADSVRLQFASATTSNPLQWPFKGPDGTAASYYTMGNTGVHQIHNGGQYFRYRMYLATASTTVTPSLSDISLTFASECVPPGQVLFGGLASDTYTLTVEKAGYQTVIDSLTTGLSWQERVVSLIPS